MYNPDKVDDYSKKQLAEMIFNGEVSREQVDEDGLFRKHRPLLDEELSLMTQEELDWTEATTKNTVGSYQVYLEKYNPAIVEGETVTDGWVENTVYIGRHVEDARHLQTAVKKPDDEEKENEKDKAAWVKAKNADTIECYIEYISTFDRQPPLYRGQYVDEAKLRINKLQDNIDWGKAKSLDTKNSYETYLSKYDSPASSYQGAYISDAKKAIERLTPKAEPALDPLGNETEDWAKACKADTITAYRLYLSKFGSDNSAQKGKHIEEAKVRINNLMDDACWADTVKQNTHEAYQDYIRKYPQGVHVSEAHKRLRPPVPLRPILKYVLTLLVATACVFLGWQYSHTKWPFSQKNDNILTNDSIDYSNSIAKIDSLQWAIDNHDKLLLIRYVKVDSVRAYFPLAQLLNKEDSANNIDKTLSLLELSNDTFALKLAQNIISDKQSVFYDYLLEQISNVDENSESAENEYLDLYKEFVQHNNWLRSIIFPRIKDYKIFIIKNTAIEEIADSYIEDYSMEDVLQTSLYLDWIAQKKALLEASKPAKNALDSLHNIIKNEL